MKSVDIEFGDATFELRLPEHADVLGLPDVTPVAGPDAAVQRAIAEPMKCPSLQAIVRKKASKGRAAAAVIVISDNTRPVPYKGPAGILEPILDVLHLEGVQDITLLVATGTHHGLPAPVVREMLPDAAFEPGIRIVNHDCRNPDALRRIGTTARGTAAWVNAQYLDADIKILTGLVEPHFMAGYSGGRKSVCPGLVGLEATQVFHGPALMADPRSDSLILDGNPCHAEALDVARLAGCDFLVNVTIDRRKRLTGVFCGDMEAAHAAACDRAAATSAVTIQREYDVVVTHAGFAGINHYQAAKAACEAAKAVRHGGTIILAAHHTDEHPVGGDAYRRLLPLLGETGPERIDARFAAPDWHFQSDQWEVQKWAQVFRKLGAMQNLIYCAPRLTGRLFDECRVPGTDGGIGLPHADDAELAAAMVQRALDTFLARNPDAATAVLADGPYGVPVLSTNACGRTRRDERKTA